MVLQRIQTVYLFIAVALMAVFTFFPVFTVSNADGVFTVGALANSSVNTPSTLLLCLDVLIALFALVTIFKYKNLKKQIALAGILLLLVIALLVTIGVLFVMQKGVGIAVIEWPIAFPFVTMVLVMLARGGMQRDKKLLSDSERIR